MCVIALRDIVVNLYQWSGDNSAAASLYVEVSILYSAGWTFNDFHKDVLYMCNI